MSDLEDRANRELTDQDPIGPDGTQAGPADPDPEAGQEPATTSAANPDGQGTSAAPEAAGAEIPGAEANPSAGVRASLLGEPGTLPATWCKKCQAEVTPEGKGRCPRCTTFLHLNFVARRHPVNKLRKQQLLDQLVADYRPNTTMLVSTCEHLAAILEQLEVLKPGSPDHQRLVQLSQQLGTSLEESRQAKAHDPDENLCLVELAARAVLLAQAAREHLTHLEWVHPNSAFGPPDATTLRHARQSVEKAEMIARHACAEMEAERRPHLPVVNQDPAPPAEPIVLATNTTASAPVEPVPEPTCVYCHQPLDRCAEIKRTRYESWQAMHYNDPAEVEKKIAYATNVMMHQIGKPWR